MRVFSAGVVLAGLAGVGTASGAYMVGATSNGMASRTVQPGNSFQLDLVLTSDASDEINSAISRLVFSEGGLLYTGYSWTAPFENGSVTDDSVPKMPDDLPALLDEDTLSGVGYADGVVDVELSNVILTADRFGEGILVSLMLTVPSDYMGEETIVISPVPDTFANGFDVVQALPGGSFTLIIPAPAGVALGGLAGIGLLNRRRR